MYEFIYQCVLVAGYASIGLLTFIFPTETVMVVVGYIAYIEHLSLMGVVIAGSLGTTLWAVAVYVLARRYGRKTIYGLVKKYGRFFGVNKKKIDRAGRWFDRRAEVTVIGGRFVPGLRTAVSIPAGFRRMPFGVFLLCTLVGSGLDSALLAYVGYTARSNFDELRMTIGSISNAILLSFLVFVFGWILWRFRRGRT